MRKEDCDNFALGYKPDGDLCLICKDSYKCAAAKAKAKKTFISIPQEEELKGQGINCRSFGMNYRENSPNCMYCKDKVDCKIMSVGWGDQISNHKNSIEILETKLEDMLRDLHVYFVPDETEQITIEITRGNVRVKKSVQEDLAVTI